MGEIICETARRTADRDGLGCAKLVVFCNAVEDNPFMAGAFHGIGEPDCVINVGVSGPGVVRARSSLSPTSTSASSRAASSARRSRSRAWASSSAARRPRLGVPFGIVDLSLAPTPAKGDSVARESSKRWASSASARPARPRRSRCLTDAVKKGGAMASSYVGGLSGAFIPVSEDAGMIDAPRSGALTLEKLEAMTERVLGRPRHGRRARRHAAVDDRGHHRRRARDRHGQPQDDGRAHHSGAGQGWATSWRLAACSGAAPVMALHRESSAVFVRRGGRIPAPLQGLSN